MLLPANPSRYFVGVAAAQAACAGLEYEVTYVHTEPTRPGETASRCLVARARRIDAQDRLDGLRAVRRTLSPAARRRYDGYIATARATLRRARGVRQADLPVVAPRPARPGPF